MKFWEAMKALEEGKAVKAKGWSENRYWCKENLIESWLYGMLFDEWELYKKPEKCMAFIDAFALMKQGISCNRKLWEGKDCRRICADVCKINLRSFPMNIPYCPTLDDIEANDWVKYEHEN